MADFSKLSINGTSYNVKDTTARSTASGALSTANSAQQTATDANNANSALEQLADITAEYVNATETIALNI